MLYSVRLPALSLSLCVRAAAQWCCWSMHGWRCSAWHASEHTSSLCITSTVLRAVSTWLLFMRVCVLLCLCFCVLVWTCACVCVCGCVCVCVCALRSLPFLCVVSGIIQASHPIAPSPPRLPIRKGTDVNTNRCVVSTSLASRRAWVTCGSHFDRFDLCSDLLANLLPCKCDQV